ncbi:ileal sodium/bile acid cotransporter-like isoform X1 [Convolutriloba macropyga]|uniref:ileal sodium/bile acid cotransporter-like isoform X1 n=1 Tax=Convolutriloba macropyga TaxID=536237 RepID=UPI003F528975
MLADLDIIGAPMVNGTFSPSDDPGGGGGGAIVGGGGGGGSEGVLQGIDTWWAKVLKVTVGGLMTMSIICIMINSGISLRKCDVCRVLRRPQGALIGFLCQFVLLPLITLGICRALNVQEHTLMAALINSCCPGGAMSNFLTNLTKGDVALSVSMSFFSTMCAFVTMPLTLFAFSTFIFLPSTQSTSQSTSSSAAEIGDGGGTHRLKPPFAQIAVSLASLLIPLLIGVLLKYYRPEGARKFKNGAKIFIMICLVASGIIFALLYPNIYFVGARIILSALLVSSCGFTLGYSLARVVRLHETQCRAVCFETGFQNVAISFAVIQLSFPHDADEMFAFPLWYATGVGAYSAIIVITYMFYKRCTGEIQSPQSDETSKSSKRRSHHKKINSQTVQLVTFPSSEDINEGVHYDDDQECRGHHQEESSIDDDTQHRQDSRENESPLVGQIAEDQEPELVLTFSSVASGSRQIFNNSDNIRVLQSMSVENV